MRTHRSCALASPRVWADWCSGIWQTTRASIGLDCSSLLSWWLVYARWPFHFRDRTRCWSSSHWPWVLLMDASFRCWDQSLMVRSHVKLPLALKRIFKCFVFLADFCGPQGATQAIGFLLGLCSIPLTVGPPIAGMLYDHTKSYSLSFVLAGIPAIFGAAMMSLIYCVPDDRSDSNVIDPEQAHVPLAKPAWLEGTHYTHTHIDAKPLLLTNSFIDCFSQKISTKQNCRMDTVAATIWLMAMPNRTTLPVQVLMKNRDYWIRLPYRRWWWTLAH